MSEEPVFFIRVKGLQEKKWFAPRAYYPHPGMEKRNRSHVDMCDL